MVGHVSTTEINVQMRVSDAKRHATHKPVSGREYSGRPVSAFPQQKLPKEYCE